MKLYLRLLLITALVATPMIFFTSSSVSAAVDTCTWTGATNGLMSNGANWTGCDNGAVPQAGDTLDFPSSGVTTFAVNNDLALIFDDITVSSSSFTFSGNTLELSGNLNAFSSATFSSLVQYTNSTSFAQLNVQSGTPVFTSGINLNLSGGGSFVIFTTNSSYDVPVITGTTPALIFNGNPTMPLEVFNTRTSAATYVAASISIINSAVNCQSATDCLGASTNQVTIQSGDVTGTRATLRLNAAALVLDNPIIFNDFGSNGPPRLEVLQAATTTGTINLSTNGIISVDAAVALLINGAVDLGANTLTYSGVTGSQTVHNGSIAGTGNIVDDGFVQMVNPNTYTGTTTINTDATLVASTATSLGTTAGATTIQNGGTLEFNPLASHTNAENITVQGDGDVGRVGAIEIFNAANNVTMTGTITLAGNTQFGLALAGTSDLNIDGPITGTGDLTYTSVTGSGSINLTGIGVNDYVGTTNIVGTRLVSARTGAGISFPGNINVNASVSDPSSLLVSGNSTQIADDAVITLTNNGANTAVFESGNAGEIIGTIQGNGHLEGDGPGGGFTIGGGNKSGSFTGTFDNEDGDITKIGTGSWNITGSTFPGGPANPFAFTISGGSVIWGSNLAGIPVTVASGGTLKGTGTVGTTIVSSGGTLSTGTSPGCITLATLTMNAGSTFTEEIDGTTACTGYDQTTVTGAAALGNSTLNVVLGTTPPVGTVFTILNAGSITGTFTGLADGTVFASGGQSFRINYTTTTVTLTALGSSTTVVAGPLPATGIDIGQVSMIVIALLLGAGGLALIFSRRRRLLRVQH